MNQRNTLNVRQQGEFVQHIGVAALQSPAEVQLELAQYSGEQQSTLQGRWLLSGLLSNSMFERLRQNYPHDVNAKIEAYPTSCGALYTVLTNQIGSYQHRFLLPGFSKALSTYSQDASEGTLNLFLEDSERPGEGLLYQVDKALVSMGIQYAMSQPMGHRPLRDLIAEIPLQIVRFSRLYSVESLIPGVEVKAADVSILISDAELLAWSTSEARVMAGVD
ncbi:hypothetical protein [Rhodoferax saidenbachensis]|uniref:Uncharacterized protein n=1 Tax=Rhodoferax saidenbachensis TaxID=1484693 RepID=A0ABU1ZQU3_9BURK|nr:hypothetical protein [Rhodoferax saidenbachensis]MDR7307924.1 hypothetical protein [Rhodoferax saidenbachensis]